MWWRHTGGMDSQRLTTLVVPRAPQIPPQQRIFTGEDAGSQCTEAMFRPYAGGQRQAQPS